MRPAAPARPGVVCRGRDGLSRRPRGGRQRYRRGCLVSDYEAVETVVKSFVAGLHEGDVARVQAQFAKDAVVSGYYEGECIRQDLHGYIGVVRRNPPPALLDEALDVHLTALELCGNVALVRVRYLYEALYYTDYLSLLKIDGAWKIVSRLFHHD